MALGFSSFRVRKKHTHFLFIFLFFDLVDWVEPRILDTVPIEEMTVQFSYIEKELVTSGTEQTQDQIKIRQNFPETWLWESVKSG